MVKLGSHVGMGGKEKMLGSVKEAISYNANCFMIYTGAPQNTRRSDISTLMIPEAHELMIKHSIPLENVVVHAPYIMNLANPEEEKRQFAIDFLTSEVKRTSLMGAAQIVLHPGAHLKQGSMEGMKHIVNGLKKVIENTSDLNTKIALETMAGKGTEVGVNFQELGYIINNVNSDRITVCFDTCHTHDYGYDLSDFESVLEEFDKFVGKDKISAFHTNDSKNTIGSHKDRHENIGFGYIGFDNLVNIINHPEFINVPKILETPYVTEFEGSKNKVYSPYKHEIEMIKSGSMDENVLNKIRE